MSYSQQYAGKFGLVKPGGLAKGKAKPSGPPARPSGAVASIFGDLDDDEPTAATSAVNMEVLRHQAQAAKQAAAASDNLDDMVNDYDAFLEAEERKKAVQAAKAAVQASTAPSKRQESRYIGGLLNQAAHRELEREKIYERKLQREKKEEDKEHGDKPAFITEGYKRKLEEQRRREAEEAALEAKNGDVTKKGDLSGFYRHLLGELAGPDDPTKAASSEQAPEPSAPAAAPETTPTAEASKEEATVVEQAAPEPAEDANVVRVVEGVDVAAALAAKKRRAEAEAAPVAPVVNTSGMSKAELIAAAKERAAARKRQRETEGTSASGVAADAPAT